MFSRTKALLSVAVIGAAMTISASVPAAAAPRDGYYEEPEATGQDQAGMYGDEGNYDETVTGSITPSSPVRPPAYEGWRGYNSNGKAYDTYGNVGPEPDRDSTY